MSVEAQAIVRTGLAECDPPVVKSACSLVDLLRIRAAETDRTAFSFLAGGFERNRISYRELEARARAIASRLDQLGQRRKPVLVMHDAGIDFIAALFGCFYAGAIAVPCPSPLRPRFMARLDAIARDCAAQVCCSSWQIQQAVMRAAGAKALKAMHWVTAHEPPVRDQHAPTIGSHDLALLQYTSGSTGRPKGVMVSHGDVLRNSERLRTLLSHTSRDISVTWLPPFHDMGLVGAIIQPIYAGFRSYLMAPAEFVRQPLLWLEMMSRYRATTTAAPNSAYEIVARRAALDGQLRLDLGAWRIAINGAEPINPDTLTRFAEIFGGFGFDPAAFRPCYGLAEATLLVTGAADGARRTAKAGDKELDRTDPKGPGSVSCGATMADDEVIIVDPKSRKRCPPAEIGEIWVPRSLAAGGYWNDPELTRETFHATPADGDGSYLRTGDLGFMSDGELFVSGRLSDLIIIRGANHHPQDIEATVASRLGLASSQCCAFSVHVDGEERLIVCVEADRRTVREDRARELAALARAAISEEHDLALQALAVVRIGRLPRTSSGKLQRQACRALHLDDSSADILHRILFPARASSDAAPEAPTPEALRALSSGQRLVRMTAYLHATAATEFALSLDEAASARTLAFLGADSLALARFRHRVATELAVDIPASVILPTAGFDDIAPYLLARLLPADQHAEVCDLRIASTFTAEPIAEFLRYWFDEIGVCGRISFAPYNQVVQALIDPDSGLNASSTDAHRVVLVRPLDWLRYLPPERAEGPAKDAALTEIIARFGVAAEQAAALGGPLSIAICPDASDGASAFEGRLRAICERIAGVKVLDLGAAAALYRVDPLFTAQQHDEAHIPFTPAFFAALATSVIRAVRAMSRTPVKVVVVDCDNTLWAGECGEVGPDRVDVTGGHSALQDFLKELQQAGVLLCLCSKNDEASVVEVFRHQSVALRIGLDDIVAHRINWLPKSENIAALAAELNLGLDSFLFLDDNPAERAEVRARRPDVMVPELPADPQTWPTFLAHYWALDRAGASRGKNRTKLYREHAERERVRRQVLSLDEFIAHLGVEVRFSPITAGDVARVSELTLRANQFNATGLRHPESELATWIGDPDMICETVTVSDRYGEYGLVGMLRVRASSAGGLCVMEDFLLSCRALGKRVEHDMLQRAIGIARIRGCVRIQVRVVRTERNRPLRGFLASVCGPAIDADACFEMPIEELERGVLAARSSQILPAAAIDEAPAGKTSTREASDWLDRVATELTSGAAILAQARQTTPRAPPDRHVAPQTEMEEFVARRWENILRHDRVGRSDGFFKLGGGSLQLAEFVADVYERYGVAISLALLQDPSVESTARLIEQLRSGSWATIARPEPQLPQDLHLDPAIAPGSLCAPPVPARHILLTGATGMLGTALLAVLAERTGARITCLVRQRDGVAPPDRLHGSDFWAHAPADARRRIDVVAGELGQPQLGMSPADHARLAAGVDTIIHCAATVNFVYDYASLRDVNVTAVKDVLTFASRERLKAVHFISTLGALMSADRPEDTPIMEDEPPGFPSGLPNGYEQSKWVADELVRMAAGRGIPTAVHRPGMLVGDAEAGFVMKPTEFVSCMIKGCIQLGFAPDLDVEVELVPLRLAARLIVEISRRPDALGRTFHIKHPQPIRLPEILDIIRAHGYPIVTVPFPAWKQKLFALRHALRHNALFPFIDFIQQLDARHFQMPRIDDRNARGVMLDSGLPVAPMHDVVAQVLEHFRHSGFLEGAPS